MPQQGIIALTVSCVIALKGIVQHFAKKAYLLGGGGVYCLGILSWLTAVTFWEFCHWEVFTVLFLYELNKDDIKYNL